MSLHLQSGFLRPQQLRYDIAPLLQHEYNRLLAKKKAEAQAAIDATLSDPNAAPGFKYKTNQVGGGQ